MFDVNKIIGNKKKNTSIINKFGLKAFGGKRDWDGDGIKNKKDCQPFNTMRQDTYMFLSKQKQNRNELPAKAYVYPKQYVQPKRIFLTKDTPKTVEGVSETLAHEEMHHAIAGVSDWDASKQWDYYESKLESKIAFRRGEVLAELSRQVYGKEIEEVQNDEEKMNYLNSVGRKKYSWWEKDYSFG